MRYNVADCWETFPCPSASEGLGVLGNAYYVQRRTITLFARKG